MAVDLKDLLRDTLEGLAEADFKSFKHRLRDEGQIALRTLEKADTDDTVEEMVKVYSMGAGDVMVKILRKMKHNHLLMDLESKLRKLSDGQALIAEPVTREDFLQYSCHFTLDPNTANKLLHLSGGNRRVEWRDEDQSYPDHPDRFDYWPHVLCREGVSARCYWEVERSGRVYIAVSYESISRKGGGDECEFGRNDQSWSLALFSSSSSFCHNKKHTKLPLVASSRIGVYVDHRAGTLAFYSIYGDTMTLLHRVHTTFTHTLYPGFYVYPGSSVKLL